MILQALRRAVPPGEIRVYFWSAAGWAVLAAAAVFPWVPREPVFGLRVFLAVTYGLGAVTAAVAIVRKRAGRAS